MEETGSTSKRSKKGISCMGIRTRMNIYGHACLAACRHLCQPLCVFCVSIIGVSMYEYVSRHAICWCLCFLYDENSLLECRKSKNHLLSSKRTRSLSVCLSCA